VDILHVDDDPRIREIVGAFLEPAGYTVRFAGDGAEALAAIAERRPSLVLLDLGMPNVDGWQVLEALHSSAEDASIPVILLTAEPVRPHSPYSSLGIHGVIRKPFSRAKLLDTLQSVLQ
jgi:CheY-like chemotaxis protein